MIEAEMPAGAGQPAIALRCSSWREFVELYADDLAQGGLFAPSDITPELLSVLEVQLQLPEATEIALRGRVVQVQDAQKAAALGKPAGVALELIDLDPEQKRQIFQLIEFARWQGASDDPNASLSRTLLEISPSLAPAEVGKRLSLLPARSGTSRPDFPAVEPAARSQATRASEAIDARRSASSQTNLRVKIKSNPAHAAVSGKPARAAARMRAQSGATLKSVEQEQPASGGEGQQALPTATAQQPDATAPLAAAGGPAPKPSDPVKLKLVLSSFARKHYDAALRVCAEMLEGNPGDVQALRWQCMCQARQALARNDAASAAAHYERALQHDPDNREAREFVRNYERDKKLEALPFGRYFTKKSK